MSFADIGVGREHEPDQDIITELDAFNEGLDYLHFYDYIPQYEDKSDEYYGCHYGENGSSP